MIPASLLTSVGGLPRRQRGAQADLPQLTSVGGSSTSRGRRRPTCHSSPASAVSLYVSEGRAGRPATAHQRRRFLDVRERAQADLPQLTSVGCYLDVREGAQADLPQLTSVGGYLYVSEGAQADLPQLTSVGGSLDVSEGAQADLPQLTSVGGSSTSRGRATDLPQLTSVSGSLDVSPGAQADLPQLTSVGCYLDVREGAQADLPQLTSVRRLPRRQRWRAGRPATLTSVGGYLDVRGGAGRPATAHQRRRTLDVPQRTIPSAVGGYLYVSRGRAGRPATAHQRRRLPLRPERGAQADLPQLTSVGCYLPDAADRGIAAIRDLRRYSSPASAVPSTSARGRAGRPPQRFPSVGGYPTSARAIGCYLGRPIDRQLTSVGGYLDNREDAQADPTQLTSVGGLPRRQRGRAGRQTATAHQRRRLPSYVTRGRAGRPATAHQRRRFLDVSEGAQADLPQLTSVGGSSTSARARRPTCHSSPASAVTSTTSARRAGRPATAHQRRRLPRRPRGRQTDLPQLTSVGGSLDVSEGAQADLPQLTSVGGSLYVREGAQADLPPAHQRRLFLDVSEGRAGRPATAHQRRRLLSTSARARRPTCRQLTSVGGSLDVSEGAQGRPPQLTSVGGSLDVRGAHRPTCHSSPASAVTSTSARARRPTCHSSPASAVTSTSARGAQADLPQLTSLGGSSTSARAPQADLPRLTSVGGYPIASAAGDMRVCKKSRAWCSAPSRLDMRRWHSESSGCGTAHCIAGWAVLPIRGYDLENKVGSTCAAGNILLGVEASETVLPE